MTDDLLFTKREPVKYDAYLLKKGMSLETSEHINWKLEKERYDEFNSVPKDTRQEIITLFRKGGITIGELGERFHISSEVAGNIIYLNLQAVHFLREKSL